MLEGLVAEIELRHGVAVGSFAAVGPRRGQRVHVLDPYWMRCAGWASEELAGRRLPASLEQPGGGEAGQRVRQGGVPLVHAGARRLRS